MYKLIFIKIMAAMVSAIASTMYNSWTLYTPVSERLTNTYYSSYMGIFAINFVQNFFIFIILGVILSPLVDSIVHRRFSVKGIRGILTIIFAYLLLGVISGIVVSFFYMRINLLPYFVYVSVLSAMIFLCIQTVFQFCFYKLGK